MNEFFIVKCSSTLDDNERDLHVKENIEILEEIHKCKIKTVQFKIIDDDYFKDLISVILYK